MSETPKPPPQYETFLDWFIQRRRPQEIGFGELVLPPWALPPDGFAVAIGQANAELDALRAERDRLREAIATFINIASECPRHTLGVGGQTVESCLRRTVVSRLPWCSVLELEGALYLPDDNPADKP